MSDLEIELQAALARLVGAVMRGDLVEPNGRAPARQIDVAAAEALLARLDTPASAYHRDTPAAPPMRRLRGDEA